MERFPPEAFALHISPMYMIFKASQPRGRASGSRAYGRHEMQGVIIITRHECSVCEPKATPAPYP